MTSGSGWWATLAHRWARAPGRVLLRVGDQDLTAASITADVTAVRAQLRSMGFAPGDVLALHGGRGPSWIALHLAALSMGVTTLPLHDDAPADEVRRLTTRARARAIVSDRLPQATPFTSFPHASEAIAPPHEDSPVTGDDVALLCFTSGTTGVPKAVPIRHRHLAATVTALHDAWHWSERDALVHALPLFHIHGLIVALHGALYAGARTVLLPRFDAALVLDAMTAHSATVFMGVPTHYQRLLAAGRAPPPSMRLFTSGSAPLAPETFSVFHQRFGHAVLERYGMTEVGIVLTNPYEGPRIPGSVGSPLTGVSARILDEHGETVPPGEVGQLHIRGPSVFDGYLDDDDATRRALDDGWMSTGDLARIDEQDRYFLVGRVGDMIISGGLNVYPAEVEATLRSLLPEVEAVVFGLSDPDLGERVCCATTAPIDEAAVTRALRQAFAPYKLPRRWFVVPEIPRNTMGKIQRGALAAACARG